MKYKLLFNFASVVQSQFLYTRTCTFQWGPQGVASCLVWKWKAYHPQASFLQHLLLQGTPAVLLLEYAKLAPMGKRTNDIKNRIIMIISYILGLFNNSLSNVSYKARNRKGNGDSESCGSGCHTF
jgi:hypothetical protein